jgi:hypothetical protein
MKRYYIFKHLTIIDKKLREYVDGSGSRKETPNIVSFEELQPDFIILDVDIVKHFYEYNGPYEESRMSGGRTKRRRN